MGSKYVNQDAFSPSVVMGEASSSTPIFFILFPGYSPSKEIEAYAREVNHTVENGKLTLISMGQVRCFLIKHPTALYSTALLSLSLTSLSPTSCPHKVQVQVFQHASSLQQQVVACRPSCYL